MRDLFLPQAEGEAVDILAATGLTVFDAFRMMLVRAAAEPRLPFDLLVPNPETIEAMQAARKGATRKIGNPDDLLADLYAND